MKFKVLACEVFTREIQFLAKHCVNKVDISFLPKGLHDLGQEKMLARMQEQVDAASGKGFDAILLVYGLCNNGISGLTARDTQLVIPRAHDCITLFLGGRAEYKEQFEGQPGTYYRTTGWIEHESPDGAGDETIQQKLGLFMAYEELVEKYGEDNAKYIQETMGSGVQHYSRLAFIEMGVDGEQPFIEKSRAEAEQKEWNFEIVRGSMTLLRKLIDAEWDSDFLVIPPGETVIASPDDEVVRTVDHK
jgi:hypothetical protein